MVKVELYQMGMLLLVCLSVKAAVFWKKLREPSALKLWNPGYLKANDFCEKN